MRAISVRRVTEHTDVSRCALGLDCGPIGGFDTAMVDETFMTGTAWKSNFLLNLGYADHAQLVPRRPRLDFEDACRIV
jgi:3-hydroxypropanoate dehydrogenase